MKRIYNYIAFKFATYKIAYIFLIVLIYQFLIFVNLIFNPIDYNFYDIVIENFGYLSLFFSINLFYLIIIYGLCERSAFYKCMYLKFRNRKQVYNINVLTIFSLSVCIVLLINLASVIECFGHVSFTNTWSAHFFYTMTGKINLLYSDENVKIITSRLSPLQYITYSNILNILYLFFLGMIFLVSNIFIKKRAISFILIIIINFSSMFLDSVNGIISKLTFTNNIFFITADSAELLNNTFIISRLSYWAILIISIYFIGLILAKKVDYRFGE
ncbi:hypothetical protein [Clostridium beijerinckii]|uniref:Uncharacterized protein n=1 Tax=Clostridium beijerinckii TaxID=1520 RepID=A0AAE5H7U2_CLOBE|nr:hypothetical protein [Clostridium beijerinckii]NSB15963.1 hypothetical protein [Clostridium beijerinckii]OOM33291.1 hypothetical protein CLOBE_06290 [Clostridium beijerinckii]